jgi:hypothetical protein
MQKKLHFIKKNDFHTKKWKIATGTGLAKPSSPRIKYFTTAV